MAVQTHDLWSLVRGRPQLDPHDLAEAVVNEAAEESQDYRMRLLIRDSVDALKNYWGEKKVAAWLDRCSHSERIRSICQEEFGEIGYPSLRKRLLDKTESESFRQYFMQLGYELKQAVGITVGGTCALILAGHASQFTEGIDVVGEVPEPIRTKHQFLEELEKVHGLHMGHVQSHYFPQGWHERVHSFGVFNHLQVSLLDVYDVFLSKLFSSRLKDFADLKVLLPQLDKEVLVRRFLTSCPDFLKAPRLKEIATKNWQILFGEDLPQ